MGFYIIVSAFCVCWHHEQAESMGEQLGCIFNLGSTVRSPIDNGMCFVSRATCSHICASSLPLGYILPDFPYPVYISQHMSFFS